MSVKHNRYIIVMHTTLVIEHMEPFLFQWCLYQYIQMHKYLLLSSLNLLITNASIFLDYKGQHSEQNTRHLKLLLDVFSLQQEWMKGKTQLKFGLVRQSIITMLPVLQGSKCMLDMRAQHALQTDEQWDYIVLGGVLGDHPPRDRPAEIRAHFTNIRHLGPMQLATDTAVLVTKLILHNQIALQNIPFVHCPVIKGKNKHGNKTTVQMEGFSYVSKKIDIEQHGKSKENTFYMSEGVKKLLLEEDLCFESLM